MIIAWSIGHFLITVTRFLYSNLRIFLFRKIQFTFLCLYSCRSVCLSAFGTMTISVWHCDCQCVTLLSVWRCCQFVWHCDCQCVWHRDCQCVWHCDCQCVALWLCVWHCDCQCVALWLSVWDTVSGSVTNSDWQCVPKCVANVVICLPSLCIKQV